jgi:hypothetical protein
MLAGYVGGVGGGVMKKCSYCGKSYADELTRCPIENNEIFEKQVGDTYLHELGHHLGLDGQELRSRGLG